MADTRTDAELVFAARTGDQLAFAAIYDRYADRVFGLCSTVTRDHGVAEDATAETFVSAWRRLEQLRDPGRLRPWLFAIARNRAIRLATRAARVVPVEVVEPHVSAPDATADTTTDSAELTRLVWDAAVALNPPERAVLDLQIRQGLEEHEIAAVMGISLDHTYVLASRMRANLETSMGALLVARTGTSDCPTLQQLLHDWDGTYTPLIRKRVHRHAKSCDVCERKRKKVNPFVAFGASPALAAPFALRARVLGDLDGTTPTPDWSANRDGFPGASPGSTPQRRTQVLAVAALMLLVMIGAVGWLAFAGSDSAKQAGPAAPTTASAAPATTAPTTTTEPVTTSTTAAVSTPAAPVATTSTTSQDPTPSDGQNPTIARVVATPATISRVVCSTSPTVLTVVVAATDNIGIANGTAQATLASGESSIVALSASGNTWRASFGPYGRAAAPGTIAITVTVRDAVGNSASATTTAQLAATCV